MEKEEEEMEEEEEVDLHETEEAEKVSNIRKKKNRLLPSSRGSMTCCRNYGARTFFYRHY